MISFTSSLDLVVAGGGAHHHDVPPVARERAAVNLSVDGGKRALTQPHTPLFCVRGLIRSFRSHERTAAFGRARQKTELMPLWQRLLYTHKEASTQKKKNGFTPEKEENTVLMMTLENGYACFRQNTDTKRRRSALPQWCWNREV